jgi:MFS family permease
MHIKPTELVVTTASPTINNPTRPALAGHTAYRLLLGLVGLALAVSGAPSPLYSVYEERWHFSPFTLTVVFAVYALAALTAILVTGPLIDRHGRKPALLAGAGGMLAGLVVFLFAHGVAGLLIARALHGAAIGATVVAVGAALLDLRPSDGPRTGWLSGIVISVGMAGGVFGSAVVADYLPDPLQTPYVVLVVLITAALLALARIPETRSTPHSGRPLDPTAARWINRPRVPSGVRADFRFAVTGAAASWVMLGIYLSLFPQLAGLETGIHRHVFTSGVVAAMALSAAVAQAVVRGPAKRVARAGDLGLAITLAASILLVRSGHAVAVLVGSMAVGAFFGLAFSGSLRHLNQVIPGDQRGSVISAFYVLSYGAMAVPAVLVGAAATRWALPGVYSLSVLVVALLCVLAGLQGGRRTLPGVREQHAAEGQRRRGDGG